MFHTRSYFTVILTSIQPSTSKYNNVYYNIQSVHIRVKISQCNVKMPLTWVVHPCKRHFYVTLRLLNTVAPHLLNFRNLFQEPLVKCGCININTNFCVSFSIMVSTTNISNCFTHCWAFSLDIYPHFLSSNCFRM